MIFDDETAAATDDHNDDDTESVESSQGEPVTDTPVPESDDSQDDAGGFRRIPADSDG